LTFRFASVRERLFCRVALAVAAGKRRNDSDVAAFGIRLEDDVVAALFHASESILLFDAGPRRREFD
jgi:hypothetical protein